MSGRVVCRIRVSGVLLGGFSLPVDARAVLGRPIRLIQSRIQVFSLFIRSDSFALAGTLRFLLGCVAAGGGRLAPGWIDVGYWLGHGALLSTVRRKECKRRA